MLTLKKTCLIAALVVAWPLAAAAQTSGSTVDPTDIYFLDASAPAAAAAGQSAEEESSDQTDDQPADLERSTAGTMFQAVKLAKAKLEQERLKRLTIWKGQPPVYDDFPARAEIVLAVWRRDSGLVNLYLADKQGRNLWLKSPGAPPIRVSYHAQLYSQYSVAPGDPATVIGVLYPLMEERGSKYHTVETIYIPPTSEMFVPEVLTAGSDYLSNLVQDAFTELKARGIKSRAFPGRLLAEAVDPYLVKSILVIEHSNHRSLLREDDPEAALGNFYVKLATNGESAFSAAESSAGALGIAQFMPSTYALFVRNRPDLGLIADFRQGMADHVNALIAEAAYFDDTLRLLPAEVRDDYVTNPALAADLLAAAYNGGVSRVRKAMAAYGQTWDQYHGTSSSLRRETVNYVAKLRKVYAMLSAGVFATPNAPANTVPIDSSLAAASDGQPDAGGPRQLAALNPISTVCFGDGSCVSIN